MVPDKKLSIRVRTWSRRQLEEIISITVAAVRAYINVVSIQRKKRNLYVNHELSWWSKWLHCTEHGLFILYFWVFIFFFVTQTFSGSIRMTKFNGWQNGLPSESAGISRSALTWLSKNGVFRFSTFSSHTIEFVGAFRHWELFFTDSVWKKSLKGICFTKRGDLSWGSILALLFEVCRCRSGNFGGTMTRLFTISVLRSLSDPSNSSFFLPKA